VLVDTKSDLYFDFFQFIIAKKFSCFRNSHFVHIYIKSQSGVTSLFVRSKLQVYKFYTTHAVQYHISWEIKGEVGLALFTHHVND